MSLWNEFVSCLKEENAFFDEAYLKNYFERDSFTYENLSDDIYAFKEFLWKKFEERYGKVKSLWFLQDIDHETFKYNKVRVTVLVKIGDFEYDVEIHSYNCKWGSVAENPDINNDLNFWQIGDA